MKMLVILFLIIIVNVSCYGQTHIYLSDYGFYFVPNKCNDTLSRRVNDSTYIKLKLSNCRGQMTIQQFDKKGVLVLSGFYCSSLDTLKQYLAKYDLWGNLFKIEVQKYFQPLKDGVWIFYYDGQIERKEKYKKGILFKE